MNPARSLEKGDAVDRDVNDAGRVIIGLGRPVSMPGWGDAVTDRARFVWGGRVMRWSTDTTMPDARDAVFVYVRRAATKCCHARDRVASRTASAARVVVHFTMNSTPSTRRTRSFNTAPTTSLRTPGATSRCRYDNSHSVTWVAHASDSSRMPFLFHAGFSTEAPTGTRIVNTKLSSAGLQQHVAPMALCKNVLFTSVLCPSPGTAGRTGALADFHSWYACRESSTSGVAIATGARARAAAACAQSRRSDARTVAGCPPTSTPTGGTHGVVANIKLLRCGGSTVGRVVCSLSGGRSCVRPRARFDAIVLVGINPGT